MQRYWRDGNCWLKKGGNTTRYSDALMKQECVTAVEELIANFGVQHNIDGDRITEHVIHTLHEKFYNMVEVDDPQPYYPSETSEEVEWSTSEAEDNDTDGDSDLVDAS